MRYKLRKTNRKIRNKTNLYLFYLMGIIVLSLSVGYSAITSDVSISGEASFRVEEELRVSNVSLYETTYNGQESYQSKYSKDTVTMGVDLKETGSTVTYKIEFTNYGTVAMRISSITQGSISNQNATFELSGYNANELISPGASKEIYLTIKYKQAVTSLPEVTTVDLIIETEYITPTSTLAKGSTGASTTTFFNSGPIQKGQVESIEFLPTLEVGEDALGYWDASYNHDQTVMAWYTDEDEDSLYELYIGGNGKTYFYSDSSSLFREFNNVETINFGDYIDTSNVVDMNSMFLRCSRLSSLNLSGFSTPNLTNMNSMFFRCEVLQNITFPSTFTASSVTGMDQAFRECFYLTSLDLSYFNTQSLKGLYYTFYYCSRLTNITFGNNFNTSKVTNMQTTFGKCTSLTSLDLSVFTLKDGVNISSIFYGDTKLANIDIRNCEFNNVTTSNSTFGSLPANCNTIVNSDTERDFILGLRSNFTNIKTVAELTPA